MSWKPGEARAGNSVGADKGRTIILPSVGGTVAPAWDYSLPFLTGETVRVTGASLFSWQAWIPMRTCLDCRAAGGVQHVDNTTRDEHSCFYVAECSACSPRAN
eukprot:7515880-Pyramimonas_sp.AAC.1